MVEHKEDGPRKTRCCSWRLKGLPAEDGKNRPRPDAGPMALDGGHAALSSVGRWAVGSPEQFAARSHSTPVTDWETKSCPRAVEIPASRGEDGRLRCVTRLSAMISL